MSVCIQYSRPASGQSESEVFGFDVAVTNLLNAWFRHGREEKFVCRPTDMDSFAHFKELASSAGIDAEARCVGIDPRHPKANLGSLSCLFRPDPLTTDLIWRRQQLVGRGYATCGLVHTMSGVRIAEAVGSLMLAPSDASDALICPSRAIKDVVRRLWETHADYYNQRFGSNFSCPVQTPVIPLGVDTDKFRRICTPENRAHQRHILGVSDDEVVILFVGRLSFATKAHPLPMFLAAERAARQTGKKVRLVLFGYFKPKDMEPHFRDLAKDLCSSIQVDFIMNDDVRFPDGLWAAGDIFCSLSDNVQESFGLTPLEAMASGLPAVVSDWDGYRDGVRNGSEGFLIATQTPPEAAGQALADFYYNNDNYGVALTATSQSTSVDVLGCTHAFTVLISDAGLRHQLGANGKARAQGVFDWRHIIRQYEELWQSLSEQRQKMPLSQALPQHWPAAHPGYPNPWHMFASFPTTRLAPSDILHSAMSEAEVEIILKHDMNYFVPELLVPKEQMRDIVAIIRRATSVRIEDLLAVFPQDRHDLIWRCIGWIVKNGVCFTERPIPPAPGISA